MIVDAAQDRTLPLLTVDGIGVSFGAVAALSDVSFSVKRGDIHAVIGPNGAGKSSLFNAISGVYRLTTGSVHLDDLLLTDLPPHRIAAAGVGRSFQNVALFGPETVLESLMAGRDLLIRGGVISAMLALPGSRREERRHRQRVQEIAAFFGVDRYLDRPLSQLPYGAQKLVDVARAVCMEPRLLLLDEPAAGLNAVETEEIGRLISTVRQELELSVVLIEHDMSMVMSVSDQVTVLDFGKCITTGTPEEVQKDQRVADAYLGMDSVAVDRIASAQ
jgi:branched-chain amino acid transport system ATP-binding protein